MQRILSGIQPTNQLHIGNYLGALRQWVKKQHEAESLFCIVDLHALTAIADPHKFSAAIRSTLATYLAYGIDPQKSVVFLQSHVPAHSQLSWILNCITPLGWLNRMTQFKDKAGKHKEQANLGLYAYPVLQAADILVYKATHVPVGEDQKQHIELARDIAGSFNAKFGNDFFPLPEPQIVRTPEARIMSLRDGTRKMSKSDISDYSRINLTDDADQIALKIRKAKTDSEPLAETFAEMAERPEAKNLLSIYACFADQSLEKTCEEFSGADFSVLKTKLSDLLIAKIVPYSEKIKLLLEDRVELDKIIRQGAEKANAIASRTLKETHTLLGLI